MPGAVFIIPKVEIVVADQEEKKSLGALERELKDAVAAHTEAAGATGIARRAETAALNRLNEAQKAFDARVAELRAAAPWDSDWGNKRAGAQRSE